MAKKISEIAKMVGLNEEEIIPYGIEMAKIKDPFVLENRDSKLVLVTAITPTSAGEGKTTMAIALQDALRKSGTKSLLCLREPSLGPVFGIKGGATGSGRAKLYPSDDINLHFTGDLHALTSSINLIAALIDNHIFQGNALQLDPKRITWKRALDINDRSLRNTKINVGNKDGAERREEFVITVASELMAILALSINPEDFKARLQNIIIGYNFAGEPVRLEKLNIEEAIMHLMKKALLPNLVQTLEGNPVLVHGGPFANIAHGCSSLIGTRYALSKAPIVITEAGFGSDLGAEKFFNIKCRYGSLGPSLVVLVATIKALKLHGGVAEVDLKHENVKALLEGIKNLEQHYQNMASFNVPVLVVLNKFDDDSEREVEVFEEKMKKLNYAYALDTSVLNGSEGGAAYAKAVKELLNKPSNFKYLYSDGDSLKEKINKIATKLYHADGVKYTKKAKQQLEEIISLGYDHFPVCMAKTHLSFSDNPLLKNVPRNFKITIREFRLSAGAGFVVVLTGKVLTMPGLPKIPSAVNMKVVR